MPRTPRKKRAPNRGPTSLAVAATLSGENPAIDSIEVPTSGTNIDPALTNYDINPSPPPPPPPPLSIEFLDTSEDILLSADFEYPLPHLLPEGQGREVSWSPTPPPQSTRPESPTRPPPPPSISDDIQLQLPLRWTFEMEETLFLTLREQVDIGKRADSGFKKEAWIACCAAIEITTGLLVTVEKCKGKVDTMKALWRELNWLKDQSGFGWNDNTGLVEAGDQAWKDVIKVISTSLIFRSF